MSLRRVPAPSPVFVRVLVPRLGRRMRLSSLNACWSTSGCLCRTPVVGPRVRSARPAEPCKAWLASGSEPAGGVAQQQTGKLTTDRKTSASPLTTKRKTDNWEQNWMPSRDDKHKHAQHLGDRRWLEKSGRVTRCWVFLVSLCAVGGRWDWGHLKECAY